ncbi:hypothetical protein HPB49_005262 [Dermacentor silvarum]|uniref:Uncharacterized protein n=1 Tax=Dermacentor silvarum TaxID=543639 RepID=A0ACB8DVH1_DERSI|nr:hypothetical protein HPB49_005262 [Dermacentor silvarum]
MSEAVTTAFVRLFDAGLIYREKKMNWCYCLQSAISDSEVPLKLELVREQLVALLSAIGELERVVHGVVTSTLLVAVGLSHTFHWLSPAGCGLFCFRFITR